MYSSSVGLLHEAREREARGRIGSGIYSMPLAIRVHARVEILFMSVAGFIMFVMLAIRVHARVEIMQDPFLLDIPPLAIRVHAQVEIYRRMLAYIPTGILQSVYIQFPS